MNTMDCCGWFTVEGMCDANRKVYDGAQYLLVRTMSDVES